MRSHPGRDLPAPRPEGVHTRRSGAEPGRHRSAGRWTPAVLLSAGLLAVVGLGAASADEGSVEEGPESSVPAAEPTVPDPETPPTASTPETSVPDSSVPDPSLPEPGTPEPTVPDPSDPGTTVPETDPTVPTEPGSDPVVPTEEETPTSVTPVTPEDPANTEPQPITEAPVVPSAPHGGWEVRSIRFPVAGAATFSDDWGACRGGPSCPRQHIGNDVIGSRLQPLLAATDGVVTHFVVDHPTAGWGIVITDGDGWDYRYYHVNNDTPGTDDGLDQGEWRFPLGITLGATVKAGQVIAFMGDSGNSEGSVPHLHFEIHRPDGTPINPYASLRTAELLDRCANTGNPMANVIFPVRAPSSAQTTVLTATGDGYFLVGRDGAYVPHGDAATVGDPGHSMAGFSCDSGAGMALGAACRDTSAILATIRQMESGGNYLARAAKATASGAYQFIDSTWGGYGGYASAWQAPPEVQDAKALEDVQKFLDRYDDVALVPVAWYWPRALSNPGDMDVVPRPESGNKLTVRQYQQRWLAQYAAQRSALAGTCAG